MAATINVGGPAPWLTPLPPPTPTRPHTAGSGADILVLPAGSTHTRTVMNNSGSYGSNRPPLVTSAIIIAGNGSTVTREPSARQFRMREVAPGGSDARRNHGQRGRQRQRESWRGVDDSKPGATCRYL